MAKRSVSGDRPSSRKGLKRGQPCKKSHGLNSHEKGVLLLRNYVRSCFWRGCGDPHERARAFLNHIRLHDPPEVADGMDRPTGVMIIFDD